MSKKNVLLLMLLFLDKRISYCVRLVDIDEVGIVLAMTIDD